MGRPSRLAVREHGRTAWLDGSWTIRQTYEPGVPVATAEATHPLLGLRLKIRDAVHPDRDVLLRSLELENLGRERRRVRLRSHHDFFMGGDDVQNGVLWEPLARVLLHYRRRRWLLLGARTKETAGWTHATCDARTAHGGKGCAGKVESEERLDGNPVAVGSVDTAGEVDLALHGSGSCSADLWIAFGECEEEVMEIHDWILSRPHEILLREVRDRAARDCAGIAPGAIPAPLRPVALADVQIIEAHTPATGAILAANDSDTLFPGKESYAYLWPRDGALVARALDRAGFAARTVRFYEFCSGLLHPDGYMLHRYHADGSPGSTWMPRIRDGAGILPVQEDETALVLWALGRRRGDSDQADPLGLQLYEPLVRPAARFLAGYRNSGTGLPLPSFDLWEERYGVHTFTCASVAAALGEAAILAEAAGDRESAGIFAAARREVDHAMDRFLFHRDLGRFARTGYPSGDGYHLDPTADASLAGLATLGGRRDDPRVAATIRSIDKLLRSPGAAGGAIRYQNDPFLRRDPASPGNPWIVATLWLAEAKLLVDPPAMAEAEEALAWAANRGRPSGTLPEQLDPDTGEPAGVAPLTWSHAARLSLIVTLGEIAKTSGQQIRPGPGKRV